MKKFPLDPLAQLRAHAVDERSEELRERTMQVQQAQHARARAEHSEREHDAARREVESVEQSRLGDGAATALDLALLAQYQVGAEATAVHLRQQSSTLQQRLERAERVRLEAEQALTEARADQRVVDNEKVRFLAAQRAAAEAAAEEEALEVWGSRRV